MVFNNTLVGQNGFLTAALIGGTLYLIPVRPVLAGVCLGLLTYKPQYGVLFPLVLIAASQWTVFFSAAITAVAMAFASWLAFGTESWLAFFHWMPVFSQAFLTEGKATWWKTAKPVLADPLFRRHRANGLGVPVDLDRRGCGGADADVAQPDQLFAEGCSARGRHLLITPYLFMYDMMVLAIPVAFLVRVGLEKRLPALRASGAGLCARVVPGFHLHRRAGRARRHRDRRRTDPAPRGSVVAA